MLSWKTWLALAAIVLAAGLVLLGQPGLEDRLARMEPVLDAELESRGVHIDPGELLDLIHNLEMRLHILDLRDEAAYNLFHIVGARRITHEQLADRDWARALPPRTVFVLVSNGEERAERAWKLLRAHKVQNLYILAGGINAWVRAFGDPGNLRPAPPGCSGDDCRLYEFEAALGGRHPLSDPPAGLASRRDYQKKVEQVGQRTRKAGGCG